MKHKTHEVPVRTDVDLKTGESKTTYATLSEDEYKYYQERVLKPFAESIYDQMVKDITANHDLSNDK